MATSASAVDFLAENNACGQTLLQLVSRAHAVIAEILRLSDFIPAVFLQNLTANSSSKGNTNAGNAGTPAAAYTDLITDFSYFKIAEQFEAKIEASLPLQELDEELRENYVEILTRFYLAFESIYRYAVDLQRYIEELEEGAFIQQTAETVLMSVEGKQLMAESIYLLGVMLLVVDAEIEGPIRERLLVGFYRYNLSGSTSANIDDVCRLFRGTGKSKGKRPANYPENYFQRVTLNKTALTMVIGRLRTDDIYNQVAAFPLPEHRSAALAPQAAMLYVCLYFTPTILNNEAPVMREIVDKFFPDNWVITVYMGHVVNLIEAWEPYRAAKAALTNVFVASSVKNLAERYLRELQEVNGGLVKFLSEGTLTKQFILDNTNKILNALRRCNVTLRWLMLHSVPVKSEWVTAKKCTQLRDILVTDTRFGFHFIFALLLNTAQFEFTIKEKFRDMLNERQKECQELRKDISERIGELSDVFSGTKPLSRVQKNEKLCAWFNDVRGQVDALTFDDVLAVGRKLVQLIRSLEEVQEFYSLDTNAQIRQFLAEIRQVMHQLLRTLSIKVDTLVQIQLICDLSYAWEIIDNYTEHMQKGIRKDASMAIRLRSAFIKLSSALDLPLLRIQQANSPDLVSVSQFYSRVLALYIRRVLHVIPETVFGLLAQIVQLQTNHIEELPTRLDKAKLKDYAKLDERYEVARLTHAISVLTEGVLMMKVTLVGAIRVDPKQLLEDGIRKELVQKVASAMHSTLIFSSKAKQSTLLNRLDALAVQIDGYRRSFEYISDYVGLPGLKIWQEEFTRIVNYNVEQECNNFLRRKVQDWESVYQSKLIPIPRFGPVDSSFSFVGRLAFEIMKETDPKNTVYIHSVSTWYDTKTHKEVINPQLFKNLMKSVGNIGVAGLDRLYSFMIVHHLQRWVQSYLNNLISNAQLAVALEAAQRSLDATGTFVEQPAKIYGGFISKFGKTLSTFCDDITKIGHMQIIRLHICRELSNACKFQSKLYEHALQTLNSAVLRDIRKLCLNDARVEKEEENPLLYELSNYLESAGMSDPLQTIYITPTVLPKLEFVCLLLILQQVPRLVYAKNIGLISKKSTDATDGVPFVVGMVTLLRQFAPGATHACLELIGQLLNSFVHYGFCAKTEMPNDASVIVKFVSELVDFAGVDKTDLTKFFPKTLLDEHQILFN